MKENRSSNARSRKPHFDMLPASRAQSSSHLDSTGGTGCRLAYGHGKTQAAVVGVESLTNWQENIVKDRNEYARAALLRYMEKRRKIVKDNAEGCDSLVTLAPLRVQTRQDLEKS